ncbi:MAG: pantoate--beta-alanine ligase, partial [Bacteroidota bacterium]|nr:pantoate--beta-alanine ligase [Bacteroidota bacterium]
TFRDASGLALSSRNLRLTEPQKKAATGLYRSLDFLKENLAPGDLLPLLTRAKTLITEAGFSAIDYLSVTHKLTLEEIRVWDGNTPLIALGAAFMGEVRLIDNLILYP